MHFTGGRLTDNGQTPLQFMEIMNDAEREAVLTELTAQLEKKRQPASS